MYISNAFQVFVILHKTLRQESSGKRILKIGSHFVKLTTSVSVPFVFEWRYSLY